MQGQLLPYHLYPQWLIPSLSGRINSSLLKPLPCQGQYKADFSHARSQCILWNEPWEEDTGVGDGKELLAATTPLSWQALFLSSETLEGPRKAERAPAQPEKRSF